MTKTSKPVIEEQSSLPSFFCPNCHGCILLCSCVLVPKGKQGHRILTAEQHKEWKIKNKSNIH